MRIVGIDDKVIVKKCKKSKIFSKKVLTNEKTRVSIREVAEENTNNEATRKYLKKISPKAE